MLCLREFSVLDKYEYQVCADQIKSLIKEHRFQEAMDIADTIDWRRVKSFSMLCTVSEIYKVTKHYSEARDILLLAYERYPDRANVVYALCELAVKLDEVSEAIEYYREYVHLKPHDTNRYVLLYKIYDAQDVPLEEKISLLEEFKRAEYTEKWAYELALLYHKDGQETKCVETCDELALWFGEGPYVRKALELKMQHSPLTKEQQQKYDGVYDAPKIPTGETEETVHIYETQSMPLYEKGSSPFETAAIESDTGSLFGGPKAPAAGEPIPAQTPVKAPVQMPASDVQQTSDIKIAPYSNDKYSTLNLQEELAKNMEEFYAKEKSVEPAPFYGVTSQLYDQSQEQFMQQINNAGPTAEPETEQPPYPGYPQQEYPQQEYPQQGYSVQQPMYGQVTPGYDVQQSPYAPYGQVMPGYQMQQPMYGQVQQGYPVQQPQYGQAVQQSPYGQEVQQPMYGQVQQGYPVQQPVYAQATETEEEPVRYKDPMDQAPVYTEPGAVSSPIAEPKTAEPVSEPVQPAQSVVQPAAQPVVQPVAQPVAEPAVRPDVQAGETSGNETDDQIPGQIDLSDFMKDWEAKKKSGEEQRKQQILNRTKEQTQDIMAQLAGVIPGLDDRLAYGANEPAPVQAMPAQAKKEEESRVTEEVLKDDKKGVVTRTTIPSPVFDRENVKRTESGAKINGPARTSITEAIPDILPNAEAPVAPATPVAPAAPVTPAVPVIPDMPLKGDVLPSGRKLTLDEEYGGNIAQIRKEDVELVKRMTGEIPASEEEPEVPEEPESEPVDYGEAEEIEEIEQADIPEEEEEPEEKPDISARVNAFGYTGDIIADIPSEEPENEEESAAEEEPVAEEEPMAEEEPAVEEEPADEEESEPEEEQYSIPQAAEEPVQPKAEEPKPPVRHGLTAPIQYPYSVDDLGEVEELETIDQPDEVDDMLKTRPIPQEEIEARMRYEAGIEEEYSAEDDAGNRRASHPSWMKLDESVTSRRDFDESEMAIFGRFEGIESLKAQIVDVMDDMRMEASRGNVIVMGSEHFGRKSLAIDIVKAIQSMDSTFSGKVAKISGEALNKKNISMTLQKLRNGALIVENAGGLTPVTINAITEALEGEVDSILVVFEGEKESLEPLLNGCVETKTVFDARIVIEDFSNSDLVAYAKGYAREMEYSIDDMGTLALYNKIGDMQTIDHVVSVDEVIEIVDNAIRHVDRRNMSHFMDVLLAKRYDDDGYIILREKDFLN